MNEWTSCSSLSWIENAESLSFPACSAASGSLHRCCYHALGFHCAGWLLNCNGRTVLPSPISLRIFFSSVASFNRWSFADAAVRVISQRPIRGSRLQLSPAPVVKPVCNKSWAFNKSHPITSSSSTLINGCILSTYWYNLCNLLVDTQPLFCASYAKKYLV